MTEIQQKHEADMDKREVLDKCLQDRRFVQQVCYVIILISIVFA